MLFVKNRFAESLCLNISVFVYFGSWFLLMRQEIKAPPARKIINGLEASDKFGRIHWSENNFSSRIHMSHLELENSENLQMFSKQISKPAAKPVRSLWRNCFGDCNQNILRTGNRLSVKIWDSRFRCFSKMKKTSPSSKQNTQAESSHTWSRMKFYAYQRNILFTSKKFFNFVRAGMTWKRALRQRR